MSAVQEEGRKKIENFYLFSISDSTSLSSHAHNENLSDAYRHMLSQLTFKLS